MKAIMVLMIIGLAFFVYADVDWENNPHTTYGTPLNPTQFKALDNSTLSNWDVEYRGYEEIGQDIVYYFYINSYYYWMDENENQWVIPIRETRELQCYENYDCDTFYIEQLTILTETELNYLEGLQDEL